jgi:hypothetical protein
VKLVFDWFELTAVNTSALHERRWQAGRITGSGEYDGWPAKYNDLSIFELVKDQQNVTT